MYETLLILHFLGLALGLGTSFAMITLGIAASKLPPEERGAFMLRASLLSKNGSIGLALLILSGLGILFYRGVGNVMQWGGGAFHAKLTLVVVLAGLVGYMQVLLKKARQGGGPAVMAKLPAVGRIALLTSVAIVILAVIAFE
jgi:uncharacterized membrane protein